MSSLTVGSLEGLSENSNVISVPTGHTLNAVDGLQIGGVAQGVATAFTPSWTDLTPGNATETWYYTQVNDLVHVFGDTTFGSTTSVTGTVYLDFPVGTVSAASALAGVPIGRVRFTDIDGGPALIMGAVQVSTTTRVGLQLELASGTYVSRSGGINATTPFTWATSDRISASFTYQIT